MTTKHKFTSPIHLQGTENKIWTDEAYYALQEAVQVPAAITEVEIFFMKRNEEENEILNHIDTIQSRKSFDNKCYQIIITEIPLQHEHVMLLQHYVQAVVSSRYVQKNTEVLAEAIRKEAAHIEPETVIKMVEILDHKREKRKPIQRLILDQKKANEVFSAGEMEIIQAILDGRKNTQICKDIYKAKSTVYSILSKILQKLEVENRTQIIAECIKRKWLISIR